MKKGIRIFASAVLGLALAACSSAEKMAQQAENVTVKCTPVVLEAVAGNVDAQVAVTYPKDYFHPKAILEVTPVREWRLRIWNSAAWPVTAKSPSTCPSRRWPMV